MSKTKSRNKGGGEDRPESAEDELEKWKERFKCLCEEARSFGFSCGAVIVYTDPLAEIAHMTYVKAGSYYEVVGAMECALVELKEP